MAQRSYTPEYRAEAVELPKSIGTSEAARQLKMPIDTLYTWISRAKQGDLPLSTIPASPKASLNLAERVNELERENRMLRSENAQIMKDNLLEEAAAFFAVRRKK